MSPRKTTQPTPVHSQIRVPQHYHTQPVISRLISRYGLTVNITAASLAPDSDNYGWFDLELQGNPEQITDSLCYLQRLGVDLMQLGIMGKTLSKSKSLSFSTAYSNHSKQSAPLTTQWEGLQHGVSVGQSNRVRLQLCILKTYYQKPVISELVSRYGLTVNITSASLNPNQESDGWFNLDLWGKPKQLFSSLNYLEELGLPLWLDYSALYGNPNLIV